MAQEKGAPAPKDKILVDESLRAALIQFPHIQKIWVAKDGQWYQVKRPNTTEITREKALAEQSLN